MRLFAWDLLENGLAVKIVWCHPGFTPEDAVSQPLRVGRAMNFIADGFQKGNMPGRCGGKPIQERKGRLIDEGKRLTLRRHFLEKCPAFFGYSNEAVAVEPK